MTSIKLIVNGAKARAEVDGLLTSGMVGIPVTIEYDSAWNGLTKNLVCRSTSGGTRVVPGVKNTATVPHEVMTHEERWYYTNKLEIGVEGFNADGKLVFPTVYADCGVIREGANSDADQSTDPTLPIWKQLQADMEQLKQNGVTDKQIAQVVADYLEENPVDVSGGVKTVNGVGPDRNGNVEITIPDSSQNGENGATFTPAVSSDGDLSWTNDKGLENPPTVNICGPRGVGIVSITIKDAELGTITFRDYMGWGAYAGELMFRIGMTWAEFCDSDYNTQGFYCSGNLIMEPSGCFMLYRDEGTYFSPTPDEVIVDEREYLWDMY